MRRLSIVNLRLMEALAALCVSGHTVKRLYLPLRYEQTVFRLWSLVHNCDPGVVRSQAQTLRLLILYRLAQNSGGGSPGADVRKTFNLTCDRTTANSDRLGQKESGRWAAPRRSFGS
jgi:hypothetical protein